MAFARDVSTASASQTDYPISFAYQEQEDVLVYNNGSLLTITTDYTFADSTTIRLVVASTAGDTVVRQRSTSQSTRDVTFVAGTLTAADLNTAAIQAFYMAQESIDIANIKLGKASDEIWDAESTRIKNVDTPTESADAVTKSYVDTLAISGTVGTPVSVPDGGTASVTAAAARTALGLAIGTDIASIGANSFTGDQILVSTDAGLGDAPNITLDRQSSSPLANDTLASIASWGRNDAAEAVVYAKQNTVITAVGDGAEGGRVGFWTIVGGTIAPRLYIGDGVFTPGVTGGDKGVDTINASALYIGGALLAAATQAQQETGTDIDTFVTPGRQQFHPASAKGWIKMDGSGTIAINDSYNVTGIADNGTGVYTITWATDFSSADYAVAAFGGDSASSSSTQVIGRNNEAVAAGGWIAGAITISNEASDGSNLDTDELGLIAFGDQ